MSFSSHFGATGVVSLLAPVDAANTAAATGAWVQIPAGAVGEIEVTAHAGVLDAGTVDWTLETASDGGGTGAAAVTFNEGAFDQVTTSNDDPNIQTRTFDAKLCKGFVKIKGTIATGGALVAASARYAKKYA